MNLPTIIKQIHYGIQYIYDILYGHQNIYHMVQIYNAIVIVTGEICPVNAGFEFIVYSVASVLGCALQRYLLRYQNIQMPLQRHMETYIFLMGYTNTKIKLYILENLNSVLIISDYLWPKIHEWNLHRMVSVLGARFGDICQDIRTLKCGFRDI